MRAIVTVVGKDRIGIIAAVSTLLAENSVNILDISQTIMQDFFTMIMLVDASDAAGTFSDIQKSAEELGKSMELSIRMQREDIFQSMHRI